MTLALLVTAAIALTVPGFVLAVRALPWVSRQVEAGIKPWACDICMCFWSTGALALAVAAWLGGELVLCAGPAYTVALIVISHMERPTTPPPIPTASALLPEGLAERLEPKEES